MSPPYPHRVTPDLLLISDALTGNSRRTENDHESPRGEYHNGTENALSGNTRRCGLRTDEENALTTKVGQMSNLPGWNITHPPWGVQIGKPLCEIGVILLRFWVA